jgi:hypothetical protein
LKKVPDARRARFERFERFEPFKLFKQFKQSSTLKRGDRWFDGLSMSGVPYMRLYFLTARPEPFDSSVRPELRRRMNGWLRTGTVEGGASLTGLSKG